MNPLRYTLSLAADSLKMIMKGLGAKDLKLIPTNAKVLLHRRLQFTAAGETHQSLLGYQQCSALQHFLALLHRRVDLHHLELHPRSVTRVAGVVDVIATRGTPVTLELDDVTYCILVRA